MNRFLRKTFGFVSACVLGLAAVTATANAADEKEALWSNVQKSGVLRCGAAVAPPHVMRDPKTGEYSGVYVDLCREFAEKVLGVKAEFVDTTWDNIIAGLQSGKWDMSLALNRKPQRAMAINFSIAPLYDQSSIAYNKSNPKIPANASSVEDFDKDDITLAVMSGTAADQAISDRVQHAKIMRLPGVDEARLALMSRRVDGVVENADTNSLFIKIHPDWATQVLPEPALIKQGVAFGFRKDVPLDEIEVFNIFLEEKIAKGDIKRLYDHYVTQLMSTAAK